MIREHDRIVLTVDLPEEALMAGDVGTVVHICRAGEAFEVEFTTLAGATATIATLRSDQVRAIGARGLTHARILAVAP